MTIPGMRRRYRSTGEVAVTAITCLGDVAEADQRWKIAEGMCREGSNAAGGK